jgi:hypothetical protein
LSVGSSDRSIDPEVRRLALSCLLLGFVGPVPPDWLLDALADGLGGVVLFGSNLGDGTGVDRLTDRLRAAAGRDIVAAAPAPAPRPWVSSTTRPRPRRPTSRSARDWPRPA